MKLREIGIRRFLQVSSSLIILGLLVEIVSLQRIRPTNPTGGKVRERRIVGG